MKNQKKESLKIVKEVAEHAIQHSIGHAVGGSIGSAVASFFHVGTLNQDEDRLMMQTRGVTKNDMDKAVKSINHFKAK